MGCGLMSRPQRFSIMSAIAATLGAGAFALLFARPWPQVVAFMIFSALLGALCVVLLTHVRPHPKSEPSSSAEDTSITATIATDIVSAASADGRHDAGGHGL